MKILDRIVFDLDNTLIYTDLLNNDSYNYALSQQGLPLIKDCVRITRDIVFVNYPHLNNKQKKEILRSKQEFFVNNIQRTKPNISLLKVLQFQNAEYCFLWTSAEEIRVQALLEYYNINNAFKKILYSDKINVVQDIEKLCELCECKSEQLTIYEDNYAVIKKLRQLKLNVISV